MKRLKILRWRDGSLSELDDKIAEGSFLHVELNDGVGFDTMISPEQVKEFVYGNLFSEGFIKTVEEVLNYREKKKGDNIRAEVTLPEGKKIPYERNYNILWTDCASPSLIQKRMGDKLAKARTTLKLNPQKIIEASRKVRDLSGPYKETGALHSAFLFDENMDTIAYAHDVSRHNAVDKVIGMRLLSGESFDDKVIMTTGRITSSLVLKCLRVGIPMVVSRGAPLFDSIELAREYGLGVIGFLRGKRFNIYSGEEMLSVGDAPG
jgi:FdhD protein